VYLPNCFEMAEKARRGDMLEKGALKQKEIRKQA
jgi:hypothetical protein